MRRSPVLAVSMGDPAGIGPEVIVKAFLARPKAAVLAFGVPQAFKRAASASGLALPLRSVESPANARFEPGVLDVVPVGGSLEDVAFGQVSAAAGRLAFESLCAAARACAGGAADALVTAPVHKTSLRAAGIVAEGQTQILGDLWGLDRFGMLAVGGNLRVLLLTRHAPLRRALDSVTADGVSAHLGLLDRTLRRLGIGAPRLAVAGFNPHAGEGGLFGSEDDGILAPAVADARRQGIDARGPLPADSVFGRALRGEFDGVLALTHDQGLIAVKTVAFETAVTVLAGSPHLRVSVIHGAAFDRAGKGVADSSNLEAALAHAADWAPAWNSTTPRRNASALPHPSTNP